MASGRAKAIVLVVALVRAIEFIYGNCKKICQALPGEQSFFLKKNGEYPFCSISNE